MANRRPQNAGGRRMDFGGRVDRNKNFNRPGVSPWQGGGPSSGIQSLLPLGGNSTEATLALANNLISNLLQTRQNTVPSLLDMPMRRDFGGDMGRFDRGFGPNRMGNQGNFRRTGNYNRNGERININRKPFRPHDGPRKQNHQRKEADKAKPVVKVESTAPAETLKTESTAETSETNAEDKTVNPTSSDAKPTRYDNISRDLLKCHICNKSMWDGRSFENHLNGRAHSIMMQKAAESYALTADTMREEFKIREMKFTRKTGVSSRDFYCAMCDMYAADGAAHRTSAGHRRLKKYLHPNCTICHKEMPTRLELDEHRLSAEHLHNMRDRRDNGVHKPKPEMMVLSTLDMEQSWVRDGTNRRGRQNDNHEHDATTHDADGENKEAGDEDKEIKEDAEQENQNEEGKEGKPEGQKDTPINDDNAIIDYKEGDDLSAFTSENFPVYSGSRGVGRSFLQPFNCVQCRLCRKLLDSEETAEVHLRTWRHYQLYIRKLRDNTEKKKRQAEPSEEEAAGKRRKVDGDEDGDDIKQEDYQSENGDHQAGDQSVGLTEDDPMDGEDDTNDWDQSEEHADGENQTHDANGTVEPEPEPEPEPVPEPVPAPVVTPVATPSKTRAGTRGRGGARRR